MYEEFMRLASERYSVRKFDGRALEAEIIEKILRAGQLSPTACNRQPQRIAVITSPEGWRSSAGVRAPISTPPPPSSSATTRRSAGSAVMTALPAAISTPPSSPPT